MKTTNNISRLSLNFLIVLAMTLSFSLLTSCNKTDESLNLTADEALSEVQDETMATDLFDEIIEIGEEAESASSTKSTEHDGPYYRLSECTTITREFTDSSRIITIDFGDVNCEGADGKYRRGKIIITRSGNYWAGEVNATYEFDNFFVNDNQLTGTKTYSGAFNEDGTYSSHFVTNGQIILADDAGIITWNSNRTRVITEGASTWGLADNRVEVTGSSTGTTATGETFSSTITQPLVRIYQEGCYRFYVSGILEITKADGTEITINYGDGTCDNLAEVTINGTTEIIELGTRRTAN